MYSIRVMDRGLMAQYDVVLTAYCTQYIITDFIMDLLSCIISG